MSKPSDKRRAKKAKAKKAKVSMARQVTSRVKAITAMLTANRPNLSLKHDPIKPYDQRVCGECQVCCLAMPIAETDSPKYEKCKHQCPSGCSIHQKPPDECVHFECTWKLEKLLGDDYRPDRCGFMLFAQNHPEFGRLVLIAIESYEGAWQDKGIYAKMAFVAHKLNMLILYYDKESKPLGMYGPDPILTHAKKIAQELQEKQDELRQRPESPV